ncbi:MAG: AI-2E family transporter, partial [Oscillospiraceae bacterium]|nr:AI-2E family transporter [Oscillospiraceae bacterium]
MKDPDKRKYLYLMLAVFGGISASIVVFFFMYRFRGIGDLLKKLSDILAPFIYGSVVAYLLRPMCNFYEKMFRDILPVKMKKTADFFAVTLSLVSGIFVVYVLIIMIVPQLYESIMSLWVSLPERFNSFIYWVRNTFGEDEEMLQLFNTSYTAMYSALENWAKNILMPYVSNIVSGVGSSMYKVLMFVYNLLIGLIVACYMLSGRKKFSRQGVLVIR